MDERTPSYWLPRHVYMCRVGEAVILLDVKRDKYHALQGEQMHALGAAVHGWPLTPPAGCEALAARLADQMVEAGLLTRDAQAGRPATPAALDVDEVLLAVGVNGEATRAIRIGDVWNFLLAWAFAACTLRWRGLEASIRFVRARRRRPELTPLDAARVVELVNLFRRLRCYAFAVRGRCLLHSLVLVHFLARYDVYPHFVMGVRLRPQGFHAWVQLGALILDDGPEHVSYYTPILAE